MGGSCGQIASFPTTFDTVGNPGHDMTPPGLPSVRMVDTTNHSYDAAGNETFVPRATGVYIPGQLGQAPHWASVGTGRGWTWNAYDGAERLRVTQQSQFDSTGLRTVFIERRYDALGRKVLTRTRHDLDCIPVPSLGICMPRVERTVWDGDQELVEFRNAGVVAQVDSVPPCPDGTAIENCPTGTGGSTRYVQDNAGLETEYSGGNMAGAVRYTYAGGVDDPLALWKTNPSSNTFGLVPHRSWRGLYEAGSSIGPNPANVTWPARQRDVYFADDARLTPIVQSDWVGSVVDGKRDESGLMYMRNRYYDPKRGGFTQEDPIGLAEG